MCINISLNVLLISLLKARLRRILRCGNKFDVIINENVLMISVECEVLRSLLVMNNLSF